MSERKLRDISEMLPPSPAELDYLQRKISTAGEMKTQIKRFIEKHPAIDTSGLRAAMEKYLNVCDEPAAPCPECKGRGWLFIWDSEYSWHTVRCECQREEGDRS